MIAGGVGTGKSALAGTHMEYAKTQKLNLYSVGRKFPHTKVVGIDYTPPVNSALYLDDAHLLGLYAHGADAKGVKVYDFLQRQKRHNQHSIVYTTQDTTGFTLRLLRMIDAICLFWPDMMIIELERGLMATRYRKAMRAMGDAEVGKVWIQHRNPEDKTEVIEEVYSFNLPSWWTDDISTGYAQAKPLKRYNDNIFVKIVRNFG